jgi:type I restriction enzyme R subunit
MMSKYEIVAQMFEEQPKDKSQPKGFDYKSFFGLHQNKNYIFLFKQPIIF